MTQLFYTTFAGQTALLVVYPQSSLNFPFTGLAIREASLQENPCKNRRLASQQTYILLAQGAFHE